MGNTNFYNLATISDGSENITDNNYQFSFADRQLIDLLLAYGVTYHRHTGADAPVTTPPSASPSLTSDTNAGFLSSGTTYYYCVSNVDANGFESQMSAVSSVTTPASIPSPGALSILPSPTGGTLQPGPYMYVCSAWIGSNTLETQAMSPVGVTLPGSGGNTQSISLTLPTFPSTPPSAPTHYGFNIYRKTQGSTNYQFLYSVDESLWSTTQWEDDGSITSDCNRTAPNINTTSTMNEVTVTYPGGTVPSESTWNVYRTTDPSNWAASLVAHVVESVTEGSSTITPTFIDTGLATSAGSPLTTSTVIQSPSQISLPTEVSGILPTANLAVPHIVEYSVPGVVVNQTGTFRWRCPFDKAIIRDAALTFGTAPSSEIVTDIMWEQAGTGTPTSLFNQTLVSAGQIGAWTTPTDSQELSQDDTLTVNIITTDGVARDMIVTIRLWGWWNGTTPTSF